MSAAAVMMVKDEADVIGYTLRHLAMQVDGILVYDNGSTDGTTEILMAMQGEGTLADVAGRPIQFICYHDPEVGYFQSRKTTELAMRALDQGFQWIVPCDADEVWYAPDGRRLTDYLAGVAPDVQIVSADLYNHLPTGEDDPEEPNPFRRIGWRQRERAPLGKVCARLRPDLTIDPGNHSARTSGTALQSPGLVIRHFSWRSPEQYVRKIRNGAAAYAAADLPADVGAHWRMWEDATDEQIDDHYWQWFYAERPREDGSLMFDPAPVENDG